MAEAVQRAVEAGVAGARCRAVVEEGACGAGAEVLVVAEAFEGLPRLRRHQLVQPLVFAALPGLHKLTLRALTPAEGAAQGAQL